MIHPSGVRRPEEVELEIEKIKEGMYVVRNAYEGDYEYFPGQTLIENVGGSGEGENSSAGIEPPNR